MGVSKLNDKFSSTNFKVFLLSASSKINIIFLHSIEILRFLFSSISFSIEILYAARNVNWRWVTQSFIHNYKFLGIRISERNHVFTCGLMYVDRSFWLFHPHSRARLVVPTLVSVPKSRISWVWRLLHLLFNACVERSHFTKAVNHNEFIHYSRPDRSFYAQFEAKRNVSVFFHCCFKEWVWSCS